MTAGPEADFSGGGEEGTGPSSRGDKAQRLRQRVGVYGIARDANGRILLVRAAPYLTVAGRWFLPGGGVEHGETPSAALRREIAEETGLAVDAATLLGVLSDTWPVPGATLLHTVRLIYRIDHWTGELAHEAAGTSDLAEWFSPSELEEVPVVRYVDEALARFGTSGPQGTGSG